MARGWLGDRKRGKDPEKVMVPEHRMVPLLMQNRGMDIMVFVVANAWECSWIIPKGTPSTKGTIMMSVFVCVYLYHQSLFNDEIAVRPYSTYMWLILAPTSCVLMMAFVICVYEEAELQRWPGFTCCIYAAQCTNHRFNLWFMLYTDEYGSRWLCEPCKIRPNGNFIVE